ncbi:hypothetical protein [Kaistella yonginensis]|uniref:hypothetical protein n=1 Tax=Kaistella yonginensis TaxID=658267 RepID=UPI0025B5B0B3|nr:hypothetical protein [Kaistella yonginensis]MDN3607645.1 hypothetical protein [Kaistella yonginensis]
MKKINSIIFNSFPVFPTVRLLVCTFFLLPLFVLATVTPTEDELERAPQSELADEIFLSEGALHVGKENVYHPEVLLENIPKVNATTQIVQELPPKEIEVIVAQKKAHEIKAVNKAPKVTLRLNFFKSSSGDSTFDNKRVQDMKAVFSSRDLFKKMAIINRHENEIHKITSQFIEQVFFSFISQVQSSNCYTKSLRGPPLLLSYF